MKKSILSVVLLLVSLSLFATAQYSDTNSFYTQAGPDSEETMPYFPGGDKALKEFVLKNLKYPDLASQYGVEGRVLMQFFVDTDGSLTNISAIRCTIDRFNTTRFGQETEAKQKQLKESFALQFSKEAARVIKKMPKWKPGMKNGKPVKVKYMLPIRFYDATK